MKRKKIIIIIVVLIIVGGLIGGGVAYYMWNKPHRNIESASPDYTMSASELTAAYKDEKSGNEKFLNNVVLINGKVDEVNKDQGDRMSVLMSTKNGEVVASLDKKYMNREEYQAMAGNLKSGQDVSVKCYCTGSIKDTMLGIVTSRVILKNCFIQK